MRAEGEQLVTRTTQTERGRAVRYHQNARIVARDQRSTTATSQAVELVGEQKGAVRIQMLRAGGRTDVSLIQFALDFSKADPPDRAYYADYCDVVKARSGYSLYFGKLISGTIQLRTKVEIAFPEDMFVRQLWKSSRDLHDTARKIWEKAPLEELRGAHDTDKVQSFRANNVFMALLGEESLFDFYYIAPSEVHFVRTGQRSQVHLEPIVRITLPSSMVFEFLEKCRIHIEKIGLVDDMDILKEGADSS
jgi:hypothetical protein